MGDKKWVETNIMNLEKKFLGNNLKIFLEIKKIILWIKNIYIPTLYITAA